MESDASGAFFLLFSSLLYYLLPPFLNDGQCSTPTIQNSLFLFPLYSVFSSIPILKGFCFVSQEIYTNMWEVEAILL